MTEVETIKLRAKLRRLSWSDEAIDRQLNHWNVELETFESASTIIDGWIPRDPGPFMLQALACGVIAAVLGGSIARWTGL